MTTSAPAIGLFVVTPQIKVSLLPVGHPHSVEHPTSPPNPCNNITPLNAIALC
jgi:hypothetical protein